MEGFNDPELCYEMHKPFETVEAANVAVSAFWEELYALRKKHKIADVLMVLSVSARREDGKVGDAMLTAMIGDSHREEAMAAYLLGQAQAHRQEQIEDYTRKAATLKKMPKGK